MKKFGSMVIEKKVELLKILYKEKMILLNTMGDMLSKILEDDENEDRTQDISDREEYRKILSSQLGFLYQWQDEILYDFDQAVMGVTGRTHPNIFRLKITLKEMKPQIWRMVDVPDNITFEELHDVIQALFEWGDQHLHTFLVPDIDGEMIEIGPNIPEDDDRDPDDVYLNERFEFVSEFLTSKRRHLTYVYDFGDNWELGIDLKEILEYDTDREYPFIVKGKRASPPEDCGGVFGYQELIDILKDPKHPDHEVNVKWLGEDHDPERFEIDLISLENTLIERRPLFDVMIDPDDLDMT